MLTPVRVLDLEISQPLASIGPAAGPGEEGGEETYSSALVLVRLHGRPLGTLQLDLRAGAVAAGVQPPDCLTETGLVSPQSPLKGPDKQPPACQRYDEGAFPFASVVISTH